MDLTIICNFEPIMALGQTRDHATRTRTDFWIEFPPMPSQFVVFGTFREVRWWCCREIHSIKRWTNISTNTYYELGYRAQSIMDRMCTVMEIVIAIVRVSKNRLGSRGIDERIIFGVVCGTFCPNFAECPRFVAEKSPKNYDEICILGRDIQIMLQST